MTMAVFKIKIKFALLLPAAVTAFSFHSSFIARRTTKSPLPRTRRSFHSRANAALVMYDSARDPPSSELNAWTVLATTERWISSTLAAAETAAGNPYTRKEVSYVCDPHAHSAMVVAGIFRRLKEARELGETHGAAEEERSVEQGVSRIV
jgi:hypothetical protein